MPQAPSKPWSLTHASDRRRKDYKASTLEVLTDETVAVLNMQKIMFGMCGGPVKAPNVVIYGDTVEIFNRFTGTKLEFSKLKQQTHVQLTKTLRSTIRQLETQPIDRRMLTDD